jgi:hypothetical protein
MELFVLWKDKVAIQKDKPVILLLDGHGSHLSWKSLYTAAKHNIIVLCLPSHTTSVIQPNDRTTNRRFKALLTRLLSAHVAKGVTITNADVAWLCVRALESGDDGATMEDGNLSSWKETGLFPFDSLRVMKELQRYQVKEMKKNQQDQMNKMVSLIQEEERKKEEMIKQQQERKEEHGSITFGTKEVRVLTSPESLARLRLWKENTKLKKLNKDPLKKQLKEWGATEKQMLQKTVVNLQDMAVKMLLERERGLTELFEMELKSAQVHIPKKLDSFFSIPFPPPPPLPRYYEFLFRPVPLHFSAIWESSAPPLVPPLQPFLQLQPPPLIFQLQPFQLHPPPPHAPPLQPLHLQSANSFIKMSKNFDQEMLSMELKEEFFE